MLEPSVFRVTSSILEKVVTALSDDGLVHAPPRALFHYAALETIQKIFESDDLRLSHAEYSNDQRELAEAKDIIQGRIQSFTGNTQFKQLVEQGFEATARDLPMRACAGRNREAG